MKIKNGKFPQFDDTNPLPKKKLETQKEITDEERKLNTRKGMEGNSNGND